jgi:hypothetical protein
LYLAEEAAAKGKPTIKVVVAGAVAEVAAEALNPQQSQCQSMNLLLQ